MESRTIARRAYLMFSTKRPCLATQRVKMKSTLIFLSLMAFVSLACSNTNQAVKETPSLQKQEPLTNSSSKSINAFLEITLKINDDKRAAAADVYKKYKQPFLTQISGALSKELLIRAEDAQVLHGFENRAQAEGYLKNDLFKNDIVGELGPLLSAPPDVRIYDAAAPINAHDERTGAILQISLNIDDAKRSQAGGVYAKYREPFLKTIEGAKAKDLIMRNEDVQVIHGFDSEAAAQAYLKSSLFSNDVVGELGPLLASAPEVRVYTLVR